MHFDQKAIPENQRLSAENRICDSVHRIPPINKKSLQEKSIKHIVEPAATNYPVRCGEGDNHFEQHCNLFSNIKSIGLTVPQNPCKMLQLE